MKYIILAVIIALSGCSINTQNSTSDDTPPSSTETPVPPSSDSDNKQNHDTAETNKDNITSEKQVHKLTFKNLNDENHEKVTLQLPSNWHAVPQQYPEHYTIMNQENIIIGEWGIVGQSPDQPEGYLPNHIVSQNKKKIHTALGDGYIYQLELDLPDPEQTAQHATYNMVYALVPIEKMEQSYNVYVKVPLGESAKDYVTLIKNLLKKDR